MTQALVFCPLPRWEQYKPKFLSIIFFTISSLREDKNSQQLNNARVLTISSMSSGGDNENVPMLQEESGIVPKRKRGLSDNKLLALNNALIRLRPLLIFFRVIDTLKQKWDGKRLGMTATATADFVEMLTSKYMQKMSEQCLTKDCLQEVIGDCDELFKEYKDRMLKCTSVEEFLQDLGILQDIVREYETVENYIMSHF